jgi:hypothetical protein
MRGLHVHEWAFLALGVGTFTALAVRAGAQPITFEVGVVALVYTLLLFWLRCGTSANVDKARLILSYAFVFWFYLAVARITPALGSTLRDPELYAADTALFGETPAVAFQAWTTPALTDLLSACYLSYHVYLTIALFHALCMPAEYVRRFAPYLFAGFAVGLPGYLLVPALGPAKAFPHLFTEPLTGGVLTQLNAHIVANGSSVYDVFPSLHVLETFCLLGHDWRYLRGRFWIMSPLVAGLVVSTIYLRYHYAIDLIAGVVPFLILWAVTARHE